MITREELAKALNWEPAPNKRERPQKLWEILMKTEIKDNGEVFYEGQYISKMEEL